MSIHNILSQGEKEFEEKFFARNGEMKVETFLDVKEWIKTFATRIVEEVNHESNIRRLDEITKILGLFHAILKELYGKELADELMARFNSAYRDIELDSRTKLQKMKG